MQEKKEKIKNLRTSEKPYGTSNTTSRHLKKTGLDKEISILDAITTPGELIRETLINFMWGFLGNSIVVFVAKELDFLVLINYIVYYILISYILNKVVDVKYVEDRLGHDRKYGLNCTKLREYYISKNKEIPKFLNLFDYLDRQYGGEK